jgi:beta-phosphoglucomutase-like phosphatase (HAD superfamily)
MLDALGARDAIGTVVSSGDVEKAKPEPDIIGKALRESGTDPAARSWSGTRSGT